MLEGNFTQAIVDCFNAPRANSFDYNLLEPLQKLLRLSSPIAASLARSDMFSGLAQKLCHKKAVVRLNLLRIVRSIWDHAEEDVDIRGHSLFEVIQRLSETDPAVLVRNMASELVKSNFEKEQETNSGGRPRLGANSRRQSTYNSPTLHQIVSAPLTPTNLNRPQSAFIDGSVTPRRMVMPSSSNGSDSTVYRPGSREGPQMTRRTSGEIINGTSLSKSRLPRTSMLRTTRSSMAAPTPRDEQPTQPTSIRREQISRPKEHSRSGSTTAGTGPLANPKRRNRPPSGDIKWS